MRNSASAAGLGKPVVAAGSRDRADFTPAAVSPCPRAAIGRGSGRAHHAGELLERLVLCRSPSWGGIFGFSPGRSFARCRGVTAVVVAGGSPGIGRGASLSNRTLPPAAALRNFGPCRMSGRLGISERSRETLGRANWTARQETELMARRAVCEGLFTPKSSRTVCCSPECAWERYLALKRVRRHTIKGREAERERKRRSRARIRGELSA
jgi:hypothetical protein